MENTRQTNRSHANDKDVLMSSVARSGDNRSYRSDAGALVLGRLYPITYQHLMPATKYRGANRANITFNPLSSELLGNVDVCMHNFFVPYRAIDKSFETLMTPTKLNSMGALEFAPSFDFKKLLDKVMYIFKEMFDITYSAPRFTVTFKATNWFTFVSNLTTSFNTVYLGDAITDLSNQLSSIFGNAYTPGSHAYIIDKTTDFHTQATYNTIYNALVCVFDFFVGRGSLLDYFGYNIVTHKDIDQSLQFGFANYTTGTLDFATLLGSNNMFYGANKTYELQNEYALRAYYAIWFEYYRHYDVEPRSSSLPEWRNFGSGTIFTNINNAAATLDLHYCIPRIRCWEKDMFTSAGVDDISRHVFAPIASSDLAYGLENGLAPDNYPVESTLSDIQTAWRDPNTGTINNITVSIPSGLLSSLKSNYNSAVINFDSAEDGSFSLSLQHLRKAHMLENWLKRLYYGGDEYRDRMLSLYDARIEDYRINRPQWLSSSLDSRDVNQLMANTGVAPDTSGAVAPIGTRVASATATVNGSDVFTDFTPEFGIYIGIQSIMPKASYDVLCYQNLMIKYSDFPCPQFANSMEDTILRHELARGLRVGEKTPFGYARYGHAYTQRVDEVHGNYLDEKFDNVFSRSFNTNNVAEVPKLSYGWVHCRPSLPMFVDTVLLNGQCYGSFMHDFFVEHCLPSPVETI